MLESERQSVQADNVLRTWIPELSLYQRCSHQEQHRQNVAPSVVNCNEWSVELRLLQQSNGIQSAYPMNVAAESILQRHFSIQRQKLDCPQCMITRDWSDTCFGSRASAPSVLAFSFPQIDPSGRTDVHKLIDLTTINTLRANETEYELCGVVYSLPSHYIAEVCR